MNLFSASKQELYQIAADEDCPLDMKYAAVRELKRRRNLSRAKPFVLYDEREEQKIAELYLKGYRLRDIGTRFGRSKDAIDRKLQDLHKAGLPYRSVMRWSRNGKVPEYMRRWMPREAVQT